MLLQFSVTNHRSIKDTAIISLKASTDKSLVDCLISPDEKKQLVPVLALYGANAAGKSNVLHALLLDVYKRQPSCQKNRGGRSDRRYLRCVPVGRKNADL